MLSAPVRGVVVSEVARLGPRCNVLHRVIETEVEPLVILTCIQTEYRVCSVAAPAPTFLPSSLSSPSEHNPLKYVHASPVHNEVDQQTPATKTYPHNPTMPLFFDSLISG